MATVECGKCKCPSMDLFDVESRVGHAAAAFVCPHCGFIAFLGKATPLFVQAIESEVAKLQKPRR